MINTTLMLLFAKPAEINDDKKDMFSHNISVFCDFLPFTVLQLKIDIQYYTKLQEKLLFWANSLIFLTKSDTICYYWFLIV
jgi:hypothetical protein